MRDDVYKRGKYWWVSRPTRRSTRCTARGAAELVAARWERERADPDYAAAETATFGGAVSEFLSSLKHKDKAEDTKKMYREKCGVLVRHFGADSPLNATVNARRVDQFIADRGKEPVAWNDKGEPVRFVTANTIHKELVALRQVLKHARRRGEFRRDPRDVLPVAFSPKYEPRKTSLTFDQAARIVGDLEPHRAAQVAFFIATAARLKELKRARRVGVDVGTGLVHIRGTKTGEADKVITVPPFARPLLAFSVAHADGKDGALFTPWTNVLRGLAKACARVGAPRVTPNDLRRTIATWMIEGGASDYLVSKYLRHKTTAMVHKVYGKPGDQALAALIAEQTGSVPTVYIGGSEAQLTEANESEDEAEKSLETVGRPGLEPGTYGLKGRERRTKSVSKNRDVGSDSGDPVPPAYTPTQRETLLDLARQAMAAVYGGRVPDELWSAGGAP